MSDNFSQNYVPELVESVVQVAGGPIGSSLVNSLRKSFAYNSQVQRGDYYMDQSRTLLQNHLQLMELDEQDTIHREYEILRKVKQDLDKHNGSKLQKFLKARKYKRVSKETHPIVKDASDRAIYRIMDQFAEAKRSPGSGSGSDESGSGPMTSTAISNPFSDSHAISNLSQVTVNEPHRVEMSTYQEEATTQAAVVLNLFGRDASVQHLVVTFSTPAFPGDRTHSGASQSTVLEPEAPVALSLHREDGSSPRLITAPLTDVPESDEMVDEQGENILLIGAQRASKFRYRLGADFHRPAGTSTLDLPSRSESAE